MQQLVNRLWRSPTSQERREGSQTPPVCEQHVWETPRSAEPALSLQVQCWASAPCAATARTSAARTSAERLVMSSVSGCLILPVSGHSEYE